MGLITVDKSTCKKDEICVRECPLLLISLGKDNGYPQIEPSREKDCLSCGHCVAVCPNGAISHRDASIQDCPPIRRELSVDFQQVQQFLRSRRSIRSFKNREVEKDKIQTLIETARYAPTGSNRQLVQWQVYTDRERIDEIAEAVVDCLRDTVEKGSQHPMADNMRLVVAAWQVGIDVVLWKAPALLIASAPKSATSGFVDVILALSYLELTATTMQLGTCWAGFLQYALRSWPALRELVRLPETHTHFFPMMLGYPKAKYYRLPERKKPVISWH